MTGTTLCALKLADSGNMTLHANSVRTVLAESDLPRVPLDDCLYNGGTLKFD